LFSIGIRDICAFFKNKKTLKILKKINKNEKYFGKMKKTKNFLKNKKKSRKMKTNE